MKTIPQSALRELLRQWKTRIFDVDIFDEAAAMVAELELLTESAQEPYIGAIQIVPKDPTVEMKREGFKAVVDASRVQIFGEAISAAGYLAMLEHAPRVAIPDLVVMKAGAVYGFHAGEAQFHIPAMRRALEATFTIFDWERAMNEMTLFRIVAAACIFILGWFAGRSSFWMCEWRLQPTAWREIDGSGQEVIDADFFGIFPWTKKRPVAFIGSGTVWNEWPTGERAPTWIEEILADFASGARMRSELGDAMSDAHQKIGSLQINLEADTEIFEAALKRALDEAGGALVPKRWQAVPERPTDTMLVAGRDAIWAPGARSGVKERELFKLLRRGYRAMLEKAPKAAEAERIALDRSEAS